MRPTLTLKKKPAPAVPQAPAPVVAVTPDPIPPVEPVAPTVSVAPTEPAPPAKSKPAKPSFKEVQAAKEAKEARAAANRLLNEEQHARRLAQWDQVKPLVDAYCSDQPLLRETVLVDGVECFRPLAVGVHKTILAWLREQPQTLGCSNILLTDLIKAALAPHVAKPPYLAGLLKFQDRFDLDGHVAGVVEDKHRARAQKAWQKLQTTAMPAGEASHPS